MYNDVIIYQDVKPDGTNGGGITSGGWRTRTLNSTQFSQQSTVWSSLSSNQVTLQPGKYYIEAMTTAYDIAENKLKIRNITDSTDDIIGLSCIAQAGNKSTNQNSFLFGVLEPTSEKTYELQQYCNTTKATNGFGIGSSYGVDEVYCNLKIVKLV